MLCFASAGQQRSCLLACSLAQIEVYFDEYGEYPVFLLDDVDTELDEMRLNGLIEYLSAKTQLFVTTAKPDLFRKEKLQCPVNCYRVDSGSVEFLETQVEFAKM